jgi:hypothetical protein
MPHLVRIGGVLEGVCPPYVENTKERHARHDAGWHHGGGGTE